MEFDREGKYNIGFSNYNRNHWCKYSGNRINVISSLLIQGLKNINTFLKILFFYKIELKTGLKYLESNFKLYDRLLLSTMILKIERILVIILRIKDRYFILVFIR